MRGLLSFDRNDLRRSSIMLDQYASSLRDSGSEIRERDGDGDTLRRDEGNVNIAAPDLDDGRTLNEQTRHTPAAFRWRDSNPCAAPDQIRLVNERVTPARAA